MSPDDFDSTSVPGNTAVLAQRRPGRAPTIAAAPTGARAERVRGLLEHTAECTDPAEQQRYRRMVVTEYLPVAKSLASRYSGRGVERCDLEQLAFLGLVKAVRRWQPGRSEDFLQFAVPTIVGEIKRYFRDHSWLVRPPRRIQELRAAISEAEQSGRHRDGSGPTEAELAAATGVTHAGNRRGAGRGGMLPASLAGREPGRWACAGPELGR